MIPSAGLFSLPLALAVSLYFALLLPSFSAPISPLTLSGIARYPFIWWPPAIFLLSCTPSCLRPAGGAILLSLLPLVSLPASITLGPGNVAAVLASVYDSAAKMGILEQFSRHVQHRRAGGGCRENHLPKPQVLSWYRLAPVSVHEENNSA